MDVSKQKNTCLFLQTVVIFGQMAEPVDKILLCDYHIEQYFPLVLFLQRTFVS